jgi:hypothetical protein
MNAVEAMKSVSNRERVLTVTSELQEPSNVLIEVQDPAALIQGTWKDLRGFLYH